jgi:hypothetical protein
MDKGWMAMKYWTIVEPGNDGVSPVYTTLSEQEILDQYWDHWYGMMCKKYGKEEVDAKWCKQDCIDDWVVVNWAWESN